MSSVVFYVSGHGFGHARRSAAIIAELLARNPDVNVVVRTSAPVKIFAGMEKVQVSSPELPLDFGAAEHDAMSIDPARTVRGAMEILASREEIIFREGKFLREVNAKCVVADVPFIVGDVVEEFRRSAWNMPTFAAGNFTWDWIYELYAKASTAMTKMLPIITRSYSHFDAYFRYPFSHDVTAFKRVIDVPLIVHEPSMPRSEVEKQLGLTDDKRPRVLVAMRGGLSNDLVTRVANASPDFLFLTLQPSPHAPENLRTITVQIDFTDLMSACDIAVSKLGYGIVADAIACGTRLLWPARSDFREDELFRPTLGDFARQIEIPRDDLRSGNWRDALVALMKLPPPPKRMATNGAEACAAHIASAMR